MALNSPTPNLVQNIKVTVEQLNVGRLPNLRCYNNAYAMLFHAGVAISRVRRVQLIAEIT
jgi:hypothetical protein